MANIPAPAGARCAPRASRLTLQEMLFGAETILFANGQYIGTGFQAKAESEVTPERFIVDGIGV